MLKTSNSTLKKKQFCTPRAGNLGYVLLTSRIRLKYFYQCVFLQTLLHNLTVHVPKTLYLTKLTNCLSEAMSIIICTKKNFLWMTQGLILTSKLHIKYWHSPINAVNVDKHKKNTESKKPHKPTMWDLCTID